ncbi:hypothetical protein IWQ57_003565, partial [Coemansia nantahalensis]
RDAARGAGGVHAPDHRAAEQLGGGAGRHSEAGRVCPAAADPPSGGAPDAHGVCVRRRGLGRLPRRRAGPPPPGPRHGRRPPPRALRRPQPAPREPGRLQPHPDRRDGRDQRRGL